MRGAADFKQIALDALRGRWLTAVFTGFAASLIGAELTANYGKGVQSKTSYQNLISGLQISQMGRLISTLFGFAVLIFVMWLIVTTVISGAGKLGYATFNLKLIDGKDVVVSDLFSQFHRLGDGFCMKFLMGLYTALWSLLFVIPGLIKTFSYAMTPYILAEHPELSVTDAITESRRIMDGNKWRLFCLQLSFIGWELLCAVPMLLVTSVLLGIGNGSRSAASLLMAVPGGVLMFVGACFLRAYQQAAYAAFYRDVA